MNRKDINQVNYTVEYRKKRNFDILIIDDDVNVAECLKDYFESRGHKVTIVDEGTRGIYQLFIKNFDIIFLDYHLKKDGSPSICSNKKEKFNNSYLDGTIITECLKDNIDIKNKKSLIFAYTGDTSQVAINKFKKAGMDGVIFKPIDIITLNKFMSSLESKNDLNKEILCNILRESRNSLMLF